MWPKLLDLRQDECRGILRRLELESYSTVVGAFRAQGTLNAAKLRILKDLREAFHISDARHKAEVRRVVNDESLSTIANITYGPNTEIEWNKEGSRGFLILNRKPAQTALSAIANNASRLGDILNKHIKSPTQTNRQRTFHIDNDATASADKIVTNDPTNIKSIAKSKPEKTNIVQTASVVETKKRDSNKQPQQQQQTSSSSVSEPQLQQQQQQQLPPQFNLKVTLTNNSLNNIAENGFTATAIATATATATTTTTATTSVDKIKQSELLKVMEMPTPMAVAAPAPKPNPITANSRRRKSTSTLVANHTPAKAMMISNRRDTMIETCPKIREHQPPEPLHVHQRTDLLAMQQHKKLAANNNVRPITKLELPPPTAAPAIPTNPLHLSQTMHMPNDDDVQIIEAFVPHNVSTIKGTRNVMNAISQGAQLVKVIDSKIIKQPVTLSNMYVTTTTTAAAAAAAKFTPTPVQMQQQSIKVTALKQQQQQQPTFAPVKTSNIEYITTGSDTVRLSKPIYKGQKIQMTAVNVPPPQSLTPSSSLTLTSSSLMNNVIQKTMANNRNEIISIPTARNPNIVKTSDRTIMHVSPHLLPQKFNQIFKTTAGSVGGAAISATTQNHPTTKYQQKHVVQVVQPQSRMVTIHPNSTVMKVPTHMTKINDPPAEYIYEEPINDWQNYDPRHIEQSNGYMKIINRTHNASNSEHDYQNHESQIITENIIYDGGDVVEEDDDDDDDIITEEYITTDEFSVDNVIEMDSDGGTLYAANDNVVTFVSNNVIGS